MKTTTFLGWVITLIIVTSVGAGAVPQTTTDPGSARMEAVGGLRFSCPHRFRLSEVLSNSKTAYLLDDGAAIGVVVRKVKSKLTEKETRVLASEILGKYLTDDAAIDWKSLDRDEAISKHEIQTERLLGFNGTKLVLFQFRIVEAKGQKVLVGYFACPSPRGDEKSRFNQGDGITCECDYAQAHVIASITGETYDSIMRR